MDGNKIRIYNLFTMTNKKVKPLFVIISGGSGSGKTTVSELIISNLPKGYKGTVISFDNFYLSKDVIKTDNYDSPEAIDWFAAREAIKFLVENNSAYDMPVYDFKKQKVTKTKKVNSADVIILEGILSLYNDDIKKLADIKIYVDVPDDERLIRRILRDEKARGTNVNGTIEK
jgi:uridine kinase